MTDAQARIEDTREAGVDPDVLLWWRTTLEEAPANVDLPRSGRSRTSSAVVSVDSHAQRTPDALFAYTAGLITRYAPFGRVVVTVGAGGTWVPVCIELTDSPSFVDAAQRGHSARDEAVAHRVDLAELVIAVGPGVAAVGLRLDETEWPSSVEPPALMVDASQIDIVVNAANADADRVATHLAKLICGWDGEASLAAVDILDADELAELTSTSSGTQFELGTSTVWDLIAEQIVRTPDSPAVTDDTRTLTYAELGATVEKLAARLCDLGVGAGDLVGLAVHRSVHVVVGLLAVLRSGAAYVPIDPTYPADRVAMMITDAALTSVVTDRDLEAQWPEEIKHRVVVDSDEDGAAAALGHAIPPTLDDLAYVIFTSGSTGRPKGVMIGHRALANFVRTIADSPGICADDRLLAVTTLSFDIAGLELLVPLIVGGCVVVAASDTVIDPVALMERMEKHEITVMQATPATWRMLIDAGWSGREGLRVLCGGEALPAALAGELRERCAELWNMYGPTETTIWSLATQIGPDDAVTIGRPIGNTDVVVAGPHRERLPACLPGELLIGGAGLAEGYLGRPDLTGERFIQMPTGERLYRTGDLVRQREDGRIEFLNRMDNQVKVRGFRIELGDVEAAIDTHPDVARCVAVVRPDPADGTNRLLAYAVAVPGHVLDSATLRRHASAHLPNYMVPSAVVVLDEFPLTLNGKVDRAALPPPPADDNRELVAPRTELEARLRSIWEEMLDRPVGVTDDIFELGAGSLLIARLFTRMSKELGVRLPIAAAFAAPTIEQVAAMIEVEEGGAARHGDATAHASLVAIRTTGERAPVFFVHGGAGTVLLYEPLARRLGQDQPIYALQAAGLYGDAAPQDSVAAMANSYVRELRTVQPHGPYRLGGYCFGALVAFEMARVLADMGEKTEMLVAFNGPSPSYIRRFRPLFDEEGAVNDDRGESMRAAQPSSRESLQRLWDERRSLLDFAVTVWQRSIRNVLVPRVRKLRFQLSLLTAVRLRRPLVEWVREAGAFQALSMAAQEKYDPPRYNGDMVVVRAENLYHQDDLGWGDHVEGRVDVIEVAGAQLTPRASMRDEYVSPIVEALRARLDAMENSPGR
jgi:amino acid adenylation domain-containing protein